MVSMRFRLIDNAWCEFNRLWSVRYAVGLFVFTQVLAILPSFAEHLSPRALLFLFGLASIGFIFLRFIKQVKPE